ELLASRLRLHFGAHEIAIAFRQTLLAARRREFPGDDAHRDAGGTAVAGRPVGDHLTAAETGMRQRFVERLRERAVQPRENLSLYPSGKVRAGPSRREKELRHP